MVISKLESPRMFSKKDFFSGLSIFSPLFFAITFGNPLFFSSLSVMSEYLLDLEVLVG